MKVRLRYTEVKILTRNTTEGESSALLGVPGHGSKT